MKEWKPFVYGGLASIVAELGTFPLDTTKTRLQIQGQKYDKKYSFLKYSGMTDALIQISTQEGYKSLYSGISSAILRQATYGTIKFGTYYSLKDSATQKWGTDDVVLINIICAAVAGAFSSAIANPTDVIKVRMQVNGTETNLSLLGSFQDVYQHEGVRGLWRGVIPTSQRAAIIAAVELPIYDYSKRKLIPFIDDSIANHFTSSFVASLASAVCSTPIDVVRVVQFEFSVNNNHNQRNGKKRSCRGMPGICEIFILHFEPYQSSISLLDAETRLMNQRVPAHFARSNPHIYSNSIKCFAQTCKNEGFFALYKGFIPTWFRMGPWNIIFFITYEQLKQF